MAEEEIVTIWREEGLEDIMIGARDALTILQVFPEAAKEISLEMKRGTSHIYAQRRALIAIRTEWRTVHAEMIEVSRMLQGIGTIGRTVVSMWQAYNIAQMRVANATERYNAALGNVAVLESEVATMRERGLDVGEDYLNMQLRLNKAKSDAAQAGRDLNAAQMENIAGYVGMGLQVVGLIGNFIDLAYHMAIIRALHAANVGAIGAETGARWGLVGSLYAQAHAAIVALAASGPAGWAILVGVPIAAAAALTWLASQRSMKLGGVVPETGWYYLHRKETVLPAKGEATRDINIYVYESKKPRDTAEEILDELRRRGVA